MFNSPTGEFKWQSSPSCKFWCGKRLRDPGSCSAVVQARPNPWVIWKLRGQIRRPRPRKEDEDCQVVQEIWATKAKLPVKSEALKESIRILLKTRPAKLTLSDDEEPLLSSAAQNDDSIIVVEEFIRKKRPQINLNNNSIQRKEKIHHDIQPQLNLTVTV